MTAGSAAPPELRSGIRWNAVVISGSVALFEVSSFALTAPLARGASVK